jgi:23S rRNA pseudouridine1911/1915/1917 synthase
MILAGAVEKVYLAFLQGQLTQPHTVTTFIGSPNRGAKKMKVYERTPPKSARALEGRTTFRPVQYDSGGTWVEVSASPARRHQVRVHAAYLGYPLVGDTLYGATKELPPEVAAEREFVLHAARARFEHPETAAVITITAGLPPLSGLRPPVGV